ncbi:hypothetical protein ASF62_04880, partial [Leifsonia sp. Leaf325]
MGNDLEETVDGVACIRWNPTRPVSEEEGAESRPVSNFGDLLGPLVVRRIVSSLTGRRHPDHSRHLLSIGSTMHFASPRDVVWGTGINGKLLGQSIPLSLDVRAVRGPYTRAVLTGRGIRTPEVYGDPALLIPLLWPEVVQQVHAERELLVIPNLNELERFPAEVSRSPIGDPWEVIADIATSAFVTGSSLHALVLADALGVPSRPVLSEAEDPLKYLDYYAGTGRRGVRFAESVDEALAMGPVDPPEFDADALLAAFPEDLWLGTTPPPLDESTDVQRYSEMRIAFSRQLSALAPDAGPTELEKYAADRASALAGRGIPFEGLAHEEIAELAAEGIGDPGEPERRAPLLSVVIPTHNVASWIGETLTSVLSQDVDMEVILVDDHSTDATRSIAEAFAARDARLRIVDTASRGGGTARNVGADRARGRYLVFCDGDDLIPSGAYRALVDSLEASGSDIAFGDYLKFSPVATWRPTANWPAYAEARQGFRAVDEPSIIYGRPCWNKAFRTSFWVEQDIRFPDVPRSNDIVPMTKAYLAASAIDMIEDVVYLYRERPGASSMTAKAESATALVSYLTQELACAELVRAAGSANLSRAYATLVFERDGWVHLAKYLRAAGRDRAQEGTVSSLVNQIVVVTGRDPARFKDRYKRLLFTLVRNGEIDVAAGLSGAVTGPDVGAARKVRGWADLLAAVEKRGRGLDIDERQLLPRIITDVALAISTGTADADDDILRATRTLATSAVDRLRGVPELAGIDGDADDPTLQTRFAATRELNATLTDLTMGRAIRFSITGVDPAG